MPDQYQNPTVKPCVGTYTWVPSTSPKIGGANPIYGYQNLIIDRGAFRNYYLKPKELPTAHAPTVIILNKKEGRGYNPIINSTRPLAVNGSVIQPNNNNVVIYASEYANMISFLFPSSDASKPLSCIKIVYDLSFWYADTNFNSKNFNLNEIQLSALNEIQNGNLSATNFSDFISGLQPPVMEIVGIDSSGTETVIGSVPLTQVRQEESPSNLVYASGTSTQTNFQTVILKTASDLIDRNKYPKFTKVIFRVQSFLSNSSVIFTLKSISFFTADRVNFRYLDDTKQLPCAALGYSMAVNGKFFPGVGYAAVLASAGGTIAGSGGYDVSGLLTWPQDSRLNGCNIHVKLFNPDYTTGSPGFAHSLNLHLIILSFPTFGPLAEFLLPGILQPYFGVIIGPAPFNQQFVFYGNSNNINNNLAVMNATAFRQLSEQVTLIQDGNLTNVNKNIYSYQVGIENAKQNQFYYEVLGTSKKFQNLYTDEYGLNVYSGVYEGSNSRGNSLDAIEATASAPKTKENKFSYNTFIFTQEPHLNTLFTQSEPCLIFKCFSPEGFSSSIFQQPGFLSASIKCFVNDQPDLFNTQLVYRIFAVQKDSTDINPNSSFAKKHTLKIENSGESDSKISFISFDYTWNFSNVLVSGNITGDLQNVYAELIINSNQNSFVISEQPFDLYCAIYVMSTLTDKAISSNLYTINGLNLYPIKGLTSFDLPLVTFSLNNDFVLMMPIFYKKSFKNGGFLQAQRDFGATGEYLPDTYTYTVVNILSTGQTFDNSQIYSGKLSATSGFSNLLTLVSVDKLTPDETKFSISTKNIQVNEVDFLIDFESTSYSKINSGSWLLEMEFETDNSLTGVYVRFEIDLVNQENYSLILKLVSSEYKQFTSKDDNNIGSRITVPFYLPPSQGKIILKLFFYDDKNSVVKFSKLQLSKNTLEYFQFKARLPNSAPFGFYEDLPIQPTSYLSGCSEFSLYLDLPDAGFVIYDPLDGLYIDGALYSPTWVVKLPENMELDYRGVINGSLFPRATGVQPYQIFFRTGSANEIFAVDSKRHGASGLIVLMTNKSTNTSDFAVKQNVTESVFRFSSFNDLVYTPDDNKTLEELNLQYPVLAKTEQAMISGQVNSQNTIATGLLNLESPGSWVSQPNTDGTYYSLLNKSTFKTKISNCIYTVFDYNTFKTYVVGVTALGNLIYSEDQFTMTNSSGSNLQLIEGDVVSTESKNELSTFSNLLQNSEYFGKVTLGYPGVAFLSNETVIFYVYSSTSASIKSGVAIYAKYITSFGIIKNPVKIFDFEEYCSQVGTISKFPPISNITVCKHDIYPSGAEFYIAFECAKKIFTFKCVFQQNNYFVTGVAIVYGNLISSSENQDFIDLLNGMISVSAIYKFNFIDSTTGLDYTAIYNKDLESSQKVGFVDYDGIFQGIQFLDAGLIKEVVFDKSYSIPGELRTISEI